MAKDYYDILGVKKGTSKDEIKKAYKKLAREHHPDMVAASDKKEAEARFKEINEAYQVLSDSEKKQMYDQFGHAGPGFAGGQGAGPGFGGSQGGQWGPFSYSYNSSGAQGNPFSGEDFDPFDIFEQIFGFRGYGGRRSPKKGKNLTYEMVVEFKDALFGLEKVINVESGKVKIKVPAGVRNGSEVRFEGKGMPGPKDLPPGDLYLIVRYRPPREFEISGSNLIVFTGIDFVTASLGGLVEIPIVDLSQKSGIGKSNLKVPAGTQHGTKFMIRGKGMPKLRGSGQGDVLVQVGVSIPRKISRKQKKILEDYKNS